MRILLEDAADYLSRWAAVSAIAVNIGRNPTSCERDVQALAPDAAEGIGMVVSGHSHEAGHVVREGVHYVNPGSAGPRRFRMAVTVARVDLGVRPWRVEFIELAL